MELFYYLDGSSNINKTKKASFQEGDYLIAPDEETRDYYKGKFLIDNIAGVTILARSKNLTFEKSPGSLAFLLFIPKHYVCRQFTDIVHITLT